MNLSLSIWFDMYETDGGGDDYGIGVGSARAVGGLLGRVDDHILKDLG